MSATTHMRGVGEIVAVLQSRITALTLGNSLCAGLVMHNSDDTYAQVAVNGFVAGNTYTYTAGTAPGESLFTDLTYAVAVPPGRFVATQASYVLRCDGDVDVPVDASIFEMAFDRVELFDSEDLTAAFQFLLITEQRVCVLVPLQAKFEKVFEVRKLTEKRVAELVVLCSDRVLGDRKAALWGSETEHGAYFLSELALPQCVGLILPNVAGPPSLSGVVGEALNYGVVTVKDTENVLPSRVAVALEVDCRGGYLEADLGRSPIL